MESTDYCPAPTDSLPVSANWSAHLLEEEIDPWVPRCLQKAAVMVIGGAEDKIHTQDILWAFFHRAGGREAQIAIIPSASREPAASGSTYSNIFAKMGCARVEILDIRDRDQMTDSAWEGYAATATGVFMTGGDQLRLCGILSDTPLIDTVRRRAQQGQVTLAGTSAGAAVMGHHMIAGGGSGECPNPALADMAIGLGILPQVIFDQHFHNRNRMARLISAIAQYPDKLGIGIDEDTCALFEGDGALEVLGKGTVTVLDPQDISQGDPPGPGPLRVHGLRLHILKGGDRYDLRNRTPISYSRPVSQSI